MDKDNFHVLFALASCQSTVFLFRFSEAHCEQYQSLEIKHTSSFCTQLGKSLFETQYAYHPEQGGAQPNV